MRRLSTIALAAVLVAAGGLGLIAGAAGADTDAAPAREPAVDVVKISGLLDPVLADFLIASVRDATPDRTLAVVLRFDSAGSVVSDDRLIEVARAIHDSAVPILAWVGPAGSRTEGGTAQLLATADEVGIAPGSHIGNMGEVVVPEELWSDAFWQQRDRLEDGVMGPAAAARAGMTVEPNEALVLRNLLLQVPGFEPTAKGSVQATPVQFSELSTTRTAMHTFASPAVSVLLLAIGLSLLLFEFYTAGVGVAGVIGAGCGIFSSYGLAVLGVRPVAVALVLAAMIAFAVDVQTGVPRWFTAIGSVLFAVGLLVLFDAVPVPWPATIGSILGVIVFMVFGMPAMTRSRFSSPTIDRSWLVGRTGAVVEALRPDGVVRIGDALWAGRSDAELTVGDPVRVVATEGVVCRVELSGPSAGVGPAVEQR